MDTGTPPLRLLPTSQFQHGMVREYRVVLPNRDTAILRLVAARGWELTIQTPLAQTINRGLFATTYDVLCVLREE